MPWSVLIQQAHAVDLNSLTVPIIERSDLLGVIANILNVILLWGGIIAFFYALYGGFLYMTSGGDQAGADKGRKTIVNAVIGIILIFLSYVIIHYVVGLTANGLEEDATGRSGAPTDNSTSRPRATDTSTPRPRASDTSTPRPQPTDTSTPRVRVFTPSTTIAPIPSEDPTEPPLISPTIQ